MTLYVNGKFAAQATTGVQRVASQLVAALDAQVAGRWVLLLPQGAPAPALRRIEIRHVGPPKLPLHAWEQVVLPAAARDGLLLNLAGSAPAVARRQACMLHDAAVFDWPQAYTRGFVAWYRWLFRRLARSAATLLTVSNFSRERLAAALRVAPARLHVVPNGADHLDAVAPDTALLARHALEPQRYWLAVGSDNPSKNLRALVAAHGAAATGLPLVIAGGRNTRVFAAGGAAGDPPGVVRIGAVGDAQLKALYTQATALVFPSLYEGFGLPPLEAMACGCPVAAADAASLPEVCGDAALWFDPASIESIAGALRRLADEPALRDRLCIAGRARVARYRWDAAAAALLRATLARTAA